MYKQIGTIFWNSFVIDDNVELFWVTFDPSVATLSINTLCLEVATSHSISRKLSYGTELHADVTAALFDKAAGEKYMAASGYFTPEMPKKSPEKKTK